MVLIYFKFNIKILIQNNLNAKKLFMLILIQDYYIIDYLKAFIRI